MNANILAVTPENIVPLAVVQKPRPQARKSRFRIVPFLNPSGEKVWRVSGIKLDGSRVRENLQDENKARCRQIELEAEFLQQPVGTTVRATKLTEDQLRLSEILVLKMGEDWPHMLEMFQTWKQRGGKAIPTDIPRVDEAVDEYIKFLDASTFRDATKRHWKLRIKLFKKSVPNVPVSEVTPEFIEAFLEKRGTSAAGKDTDRRAVSRFCSWCIERPRRWMTANPCREVKIEQGEKAPAAVLTVAECRAILKAAQTHRDGALVPYVAVCLFGGLRPFEAARLNWEQVNLEDREIRLDARQTKTGKGRTVKICSTLAAWLKGRKDKSFFPSNWRKDFDAIKLAAGYGTKDDEHPDLKPWPSDVLRHTAISHYFRQSGSYGFAAEQFGNSEAIIKEHYQSRVTSADTRAFYKLRPML